MHFDVVVGNPPYQMSTGGGQAQATPLYDKFVEMAKRLNPRYITMIMPARWYSGGFPCIKDFRLSMTSDKHIRVIHDFQRSYDCFNSVEIKGGVCYFLWDREYSGECEFTNHLDGKVLSVATRPLIEDVCETVIRNNDAISILHKVFARKENSFSDTIGSLWPFTTKSTFDTLHTQKTSDTDVFAYVMKDTGYVDRNEIIRNADLIDAIKIFIPRSIGSAVPATDKVNPIIADKGTCCSGTYIICGQFDSLDIAHNVASYINTKFFHFLLSLKKVSQDTVKGCYQFVPLQDFTPASPIDWMQGTADVDKQLYDKYGLTAEEVAFIEGMVRAM